MTTKICTKCNCEKELTEYGIVKKTFDGRNQVCKICNAEISREQRKTKDGLTCRMYYNQKKNAKARNYALPNYSMVELREWVYSQPNFNELYDNWVKSGYDKDLIPSADRLDDYKSYTFDNIQLVTFRENLDNGMTNIKLGINNKPNKAVYQMDLYGTVINEFNSLHIAERETGIDCRSISRVCLGKKKSTQGFRWRFKIE